MDLLQWGCIAAEYHPSPLLSGVLDGKDPLVGADKVSALLSDFSLPEVTVPDDLEFVRDGLSHILTQIICRAEQMKASEKETLGCEVPFWERVRNLGNRTVEEEVHLMHKEFKEALSLSVRSDTRATQRVKGAFQDYQPI